MNGIVLIDKPLNWTSFDVVAKIRGILKHTGVPKPKIGHTGTLDPLATGLLVLVIGDYCKRADEFSKTDKIYQTTLRLGQTSSTGDEEGEKTPVSDREPSQGAILTTLDQFIGEIMQTPPAHSAIKVGGQRAYKLARAGKEVKIEPRQVTIRSIQLTSYNYPEVKFIAEVSSGTYIRSLAQDIGVVLQTGAYMSALRRTSVGQWNINDAISMTDITAETIAQSLITP